MLFSRPGGEQLLDIWQGRKVFSISWNDFGPPYVVAFRPGSWQRLLFEADIELGRSGLSIFFLDGSNELRPAARKSKDRKARGEQTH
jgi:hypothetical protein